MTTTNATSSINFGNRYFVFLFGLASLLLNQVLAEEIDFNRDIRPILSDRCFACHGPNEESNESGLRLDLEAMAKEELPSGDGFAIVAGDPTKSQLLRRILSRDPDTKMPPPDSHLSISSAESTMIQKWIEQGAKFSKHWAFMTPVKTRPPRLPKELPSASEIDQFVFDRLIREQLQPTQRADRQTMIRRLFLDLTGLPPSSEEVSAFVSDADPYAYENLVDRLLDSPHFGERMALDWLDAARYADTNGFSIDGGRHMWLWRDWVIHAFNSNKPYDEFLLEQIAGDLIQNATPAQLIASGFQRNNMVTHEGGTIPVENLTNYNADRVKTLGESILGLTLGYAQCHDHKYDPITQKDYYGLFAYFNTLNDIGLDGNSGVNPRPYVQAKTVLQTGEEDEIRQQIEDLEDALASPNPKDVETWERQQRADLARRDQGNSKPTQTFPFVSTLIRIRSLATD